MKKIIAVLFAVMMMLLSAVPAFAAVSPQPNTFKYKVEVIPTEGGNGDYKFTTGIDSMFTLSRFHMTAILLTTGKFRAVLLEPTASIQMLI